MAVFGRVIRNRTHLRNQIAQRFCRFRPGVVVIQRRGGVGDLLAVYLRQRRVQVVGGHGISKAGEPERQFPLARFQRAHLVLHGRVEHSFRNGVDNLVDLLGGGLEVCSSASQLARSDTSVDRSRFHSR